MNQQLSHAPMLIFTYGNPSRGDDALGPLMFEWLQNYLLEAGRTVEVELLTDFQLQIEHAVDLENRKAVLFIDANMSCNPPYEFIQLKASRDDSYTTHAMSPAAVMAVYQQINPQQAPPDSYMLSIRGYKFSLGQMMTAQAEKNLQHSFEFVKQLLSMNPENWQSEIAS